MIQIINDKNIIRLKQIDPNAKTTDGVKSTMLHWCVGKAWAEGVEYLIESNADVSAMNNNGGNS